MPQPTARTLGLDRGDRPVVAIGVDYSSGHESDRHQHPTAQLIYAVQGVMLVGTDSGQWIVPPSRGIWMPALTDHWVRMIGEVRMRTCFIRSDAIAGLPTACGVVGISPLLRELILAAITLPADFAPEDRAARLTRLLLDEILTLPTLPLSLPSPADARLKAICEAIVAHPDDASTVGDWATRLHVDPKTIHRLFARETGMSFGQWRQQARLLAALERLAHGEKILNIALELGYSSPSAFSAMFRKQFGVTPSAFFG
jgi:AraC-like DNA-binding protein